MGKKLFPISALTDLCPFNKSDCIILKNKKITGLKVVSEWTHLCWGHFSFSQTNSGIKTNWIKIKIMDFCLCVCRYTSSKKRIGI